MFSGSTKSRPAICGTAGMSRRRADLMSKTTHQHNNTPPHQHTNTRFIREHVGVRGWLPCGRGDAIDHFVMAITSADVLVRYGVFAENSPTGEGELS